MASFSVLTAFWIIKTSQAKERSKEEKQRESEENRGQQLQSSFAILEHFPKSIFYIIYTISKLRKSRIQRFKRCTNCSWNEEDMAFANNCIQLKDKFTLAPKSNKAFFHYLSSNHDWNGRTSWIFVLQMRLALMIALTCSVKKAFLFTFSPLLIVHKSFKNFS